MKTKKLTKGEKYIWTNALCDGWECVGVWPKYLVDKAKRFEDGQPILDERDMIVGQSGGWETFNEEWMRLACNALNEKEELENKLNNALELLREIRDGEVNPEDEADKFLRDHIPSKLATITALADRLAVAILERDYWSQTMTPAEVETEKELAEALAAYENHKKTYEISGRF